MEQMRQCKNIETGKVITVKRLLITRNFWEHFILSVDDIPESDDIQLALVNGDFNEMGYVSMSEIRQFKLSESNELDSALPPMGYIWL